jgi:multidrug efflux pump subunit AcrA (membrane-fusion protein)
MKNENIKKQLIKGLLIAGISLLTLTACTKTDEPTDMAAEPTEVVARPINVNAARVEKGTIDSSIQVGGTVSSGNAVAIIGEANGTLRNFNLKVGDEVVEDQVIGQIDPSRPGMEYKMKDVKAPITGTIINVSTEEGSMSSPSVPLAYVEDLKDLNIKANIIEKYIPLVKIGEPVEIVFDAYPSRIFDGIVSDKNPTVNSQTRSLGITIEFEDPNNEVLPGMYANNRIITNIINDTLLIPATSVFARENQFYVYVITNNRIRKTPIEKGLETYESVQVLSGLAEGDIIVNTKSSLLEEGATINIKNKGAF